MNVPPDSPAAAPPPPPRKLPNAGLVGLVVLGGVTAILLGSRFSGCADGHDGADPLEAMRTLGCAGFKTSQSLSFGHPAGGATDAAASAAPGRLMVRCDAASSPPPPTCGDVAKTYLGAVGKKGPDLIVMVRVGDNPSLNCSDLYTGLGEFQGQYQR